MFMSHDSLITPKGPRLSYHATIPDIQILNRHVNAALNMIFYAGSERPGASVERQTAVRHLWEQLLRLPHVRVSLLL